LRATWATTKRSWSKRKSCWHCSPTTRRRCCCRCVRSGRMESCHSLARQSQR
jgi:hypothetical protein